MLARAKPDFKMQRAIIAEQPLRIERAGGERELRQQRVEQRLLAVAQLMPFGAAIKPVERRWILHRARFRRSPPKDQARMVLRIAQL